MKRKISDQNFKIQIANEAGVKVAKLDFYMAKFQRKTLLEMRGVDTSGIDDDIEDVEEWMRYCKWEMSQALNLSNNNEVEKIYENLGLKLTVDELMGQGITEFFRDDLGRCHIISNCKNYSGKIPLKKTFSLGEAIQELKDGSSFKFCPYCINEKIYESLMSFKDRTDE